MPFTPVRAIDQGYTYEQLRTEIGDKIAMVDILGLVSLINSENIEVIRFCDDRKLGDETQTDAKSVDTLLNDYNQLKIDLAAAGTVDDVMLLFSSTTANLAALSNDFENIILSYGVYSIADISGYVQNIDTESYAKEDATCL